MDITLLLHRKSRQEKPVPDYIYICVSWRTGRTRCWKMGHFLKQPVRPLRAWWSWLLPLRLSVIQILLPIFVWFLIRKHRPTFAGATATVRYWYAFRWAGRQKRICACWQIRWRPQVIMILHRNRRWKCVRLTVRPICINWLPDLL